VSSGSGSEPEPSLIGGPSTFASRRALRLTRGWTDERPPRLVSFGTHEQPIGSAGTKGSRRRFSLDRTVQVEMLVDVNHSKRVYIRQGGSPPERVDEVRSETTLAEPLGFIRRRQEPSGNFPTGKADEVLDRELVVRTAHGIQFRKVTP
jgi:hypothetical protein